MPDIANTVQQWNPLERLGLPDTEIAGRHLTTWIIAAIAFVGVLFVASVLFRIIARQEKADASSVRFLIGRLARRWMVTSTFAAALAVASAIVVPGPSAEWAIRMAVVLLFAVQLVVWTRAAIDWGAGRYIALRFKDSPEPDPAFVGAMNTFKWIGQALAVVIVILLALQNLGIDVSALLAGVGIGGIAVALAAQNILGDLFASLSITLDKPFAVGDFIISGDEMGTVENIGLKTTRIRSLSGEQLVLANSDLLKSRVRNFKRMQERRIAFQFGVTYETPADTLERVPGMIRACVEKQDGLRFDRCHFMRFGDSSLDFEVVYYVASPDMTYHLDRLQRVQLAMVRCFADEGIDFAYPTRTLHVVGSMA